MKPQEVFVPRTCKKLIQPGVLSESKPIESYRDLPAYILLGDPGAGKSTLFKHEAEILKVASPISARRFIKYGPAVRDTMQPIFIDALDEGRDSRNQNPLAVIEDVEYQLSKLNSPFRLSCSKADWLGENDLQILKNLIPNISVLYLDPLTEDDIACILKAKNVKNSEQFIEHIKRHGLAEMLHNPHTLNLLIDIRVNGNALPSNKQQLFELACTANICESNKYKAREISVHPTIDQLLDVAGYLCAIQLLAGIAGFSFQPGAADGQHPFYGQLKKMPFSSVEVLVDTLKTGIFKGEEAQDEQMIPVHRTVAEFLAARFLSGQIRQNRLPFCRLLSLLPNGSGASSSDLRGLCAWLATFLNRVERCTLIERDPLGVVIYGDISGFSTEEKKLILDAYCTYLAKYDYLYFNDPVWSVLGSADMESVFSGYLTAPLRDQAHQNTLSLVLAAMTHGEPIKSSASYLTSIIRDKTYLGKIRAEAVQALFRQDEENANGLLAQIAEEILQGAIEDRDDELLGSILTLLFPKTIDPDQVLQYFHPPKAPYSAGSYVLFWSQKIWGAPGVDLPMLTDQLVEMNLSDEYQQPIDPCTQRFIKELFCKAIKALNYKISGQRLYNWLRLIKKMGLNQAFFASDEAAEITEWLSKDMDAYKSVIEYEVSKYLQDKHFFICVRESNMLLLGVSPPAELTFWYIEKAKLSAPQNKDLAQYYFNSAFNILSKAYEKDRGDHILDEAVKDSSLLTEFLFSLRAASTGDAETSELRKKLDLARQEQRTKWEKAFAQHIDEIRAGTAHPEIMFHLTQAYYGRLSNISGVSDQQRLADLLNDNEHLIDAAYEGLPRVLNRDDLPAVSDIIKLGKMNKQHHIRTAFLAGVELLIKKDPDLINQLRDDLLERLLAFHYTDSLGSNEPNWMSTEFIEKHSQVVQQVFLKYALAMMGVKKESIGPIYPILKKPKYAKIRLAILPQLLKGFPLGASKQLLDQLLIDLFKAALDCLEKSTLDHIVKEKLKRPSMDDAQRTLWIGFGFILSPKKYAKELKKYIEKSQVRAEQLGCLLQALWKRGKSLSLNEEAVLEIMIEKLGSECSPVRPLGFSQYTNTMQLTDLVDGLIRTLCYCSNQSTAVLEHLLSLDSLADWHYALEKALYDKKLALSRASFNTLSVDKVCQTIANQQAANAQDLAALAYSFLQDLADKILKASTNDKKHYWNCSSSKPLAPKVENDCRDLLLSALNEKLKVFEIDGQPEGCYVNSKRADIRLCSKNSTIPIEIKRNSHPDLWKAMRDQLINQYTSGLDTDGYGIYLVFWFGVKDMPIPPDGGKKITTATELQNRLTQLLSVEGREKIKVLVIDCELK